MRAGIGRFVGLVTVGLVLLAQPAIAQEGKEKPGATCDELAANPNDQANLSGKGVEFDKIDAEAAIEACLAAVEADPDDIQRRYQLARAYDWDEQFDKAVPLYQAVAETGYAAALNALGALHDGGYGVADDQIEAARLYQQAIDAGSIIAMENLAELYENGRGVTQDYKRAAELYRTAADTGSLYALTALAWLYENGSGVTEDDEEAVRLYRIAADGGEGRALNNLAILYSKGEGGLTKSIEQAMKYYTLAAEAGWARAYQNMAWHYGYGEGIEKDLVKAEEYLRLGMAEGSAFEQANARNDLAWLFATENMRLEEAEELARLAVEEGPDEANWVDTLAWVLHLQGRDSEALPLMEQAIALDDSDPDFAVHLSAISEALAK